MKNDYHNQKMDYPLQKIVYLILNKSYIHYQKMNTNMARELITLIVKRNDMKENLFNKNLI